MAKVQYLDRVLFEINNQDSKETGEMGWGSKGKEGRGGLQYNDIVIHLVTRPNHSSLSKKKLRVLLIKSKRGIIIVLKQ